MYKLNKKNVNKTVLMMMNRAINSKVRFILQDEETMNNDSFFMAQDINSQALNELDHYMNNLGMTRRDFVNTYCEDVIEDNILDITVNPLRNQLEKVLINKIETLIYEKEEELLRVVKEKIQQSMDEEKEARKFNKVRIL